MAVVSIMSAPYNMMVCVWSEPVLRVHIVRLIIIHILLILLPVEQHLIPCPTANLRLPLVHHMSQHCRLQQQVKGLGVTGILHLQREQLLGEGEGAGGEWVKGLAQWKRKNAQWH